jgi:sec-independent protein translocase protein TatB
MFDISWMELMVIGVVALIVVGPRDLPEMFRQLGRFTAKLRSMGREFSRAMESAAKESGASDMARDLKAATNPLSGGMNSLKSAADKFEKWDPVKTVAKPPPVAPSLTPVPRPTISAEVSVADAPAAPTGIGPATQAIYDKQAARREVLRESAEKLKAIDAPVAAAVVAPAPKRSPGRTRKPKAETK